MQRFCCVICHTNVHTNDTILISSAETLDTLEEWVREIFIKVPNK